MKLLLTTTFASTALVGGILFIGSTPQEGHQETAGTLTLNRIESMTFFDEYANWERPAGPPKVALQVGHWKLQEMPDEFENLKRTGGGASGGGKTEGEVNLAIAEAATELLQEKGVTVEILPATIPPDYWADALVSIHADGNENITVSGYKIAAPRWDRTGKAEILSSFIEEEYGKVVDLPLDPNVSRNMRGYYAFNWRRYEYSMHPMTVGAIVETGFLTNPHDRKIIVDNPHLAAKGITNGIIAYLQPQNIAA